MNRLALMLMAVALTLMAAIGAGCSVVISDDDPDSDILIESRITVRNMSSESIVAMYVSPTDEGYWGDNLLAGEPLALGESGTVRVESGEWDVRCELESGRAIEYYAFLFADETVLVVADDFDE